MLRIIKLEHSCIEDKTTITLSNGYMYKSKNYTPLEIVIPAIIDKDNIDLDYINIYFYRVN